MKLNEPKIDFINDMSGFPVNTSSCLLPLLPSEPGGFRETTSFTENHPESNGANYNCQNFNFSVLLKCFFAKKFVL